MKGEPVEVRKPLPVIACTLNGAELDTRAGEIESLFIESLMSFAHDGGRLSLFFQKSAKPAVEDLVAKEKECCAFLEFHIAEREGSIELEIIAPRGDAELLGGFVSLLSLDRGNLLDASDMPAPLEGRS